MPGIIPTTRKRIAVIVISLLSFGPVSTTGAGTKMFKFLHLEKKTSGHVLASWDLTSAYEPRFASLTFSLIREYNMVGDCQPAKDGTQVIPIDNQVRSFELVDLSPWRTMNVTLKGEVDGGKESDVIGNSVVTQEEAPTGSIQDDVIDVVTAETASVTWKPPKCEDRGGVLKSYSLELEDASKGPWSDPVSLTSKTESFSLTDLVRSTKYRVRIAYSNGQGTGPFSDWLNFTTSLAEPDPPSFTNTTFRPFTIGLLIFQPVNVNEQINLYNVAIKYGREDFINVYTKNQSNRYLMSNLKPKTAYQIKIRAQNAAGWSKWSATQTFHTSDGSNVNPNVFYQTMANHTCIGIAWDVDGSLSSSLLHYQVTYNPDGSKDETSTAKLHKDNDSYVQCGLLPHKRYDFKLALVTSPGNAGRAIKGSFWTEGDRPPTPPPPLVKDVTDKTIKVEITPINFNRGPISGYEIRLVEMRKGKNQKRPSSRVIDATHFLKATNTFSSTGTDAKSSKPSITAIGNTNRRRRWARLGLVALLMTPSRRSKRSSSLESVGPANPPGVLWMDLKPSDVASKTLATLGDGSDVNGLTNQPLKPATEYCVVYVVKSTVGHCTKASWVIANKTVATLASSEKPENEKEDDRDWTLLAIMIAILVCLFFLLGYFVIRYSVLNHQPQNMPISESQREDMNDERTDKDGEISDDLDDDDEEDDDDDAEDGNFSANTSQATTRVEKYFTATNSLGQKRSIPTRLSPRDNRKSQSTHATRNPHALDRDYSQNKNVNNLFDIDERRQVSPAFIVNFRRPGIHNNLNTNNNVYDDRNIIQRGKVIRENRGVFGLGFRRFSDERKDTRLAARYLNADHVWPSQQSVNSFPCTLAGHESLLPTQLTGSNNDNTTTHDYTSNCYHYYNKNNSNNSNNNSNNSNKNNINNNDDNNKKAKKGKIGNTSDRKNESNNKNTNDGRDNKSAEKRYDKTIRPSDGSNIINLNNDSCRHYENNLDEIANHNKNNSNNDNNDDGIRDSNGGTSKVKTSVGRGAWGELGTRMREHADGRTHHDWRHETGDRIRHQRHETGEEIRYQRYETDDGIRHQRHETSDGIRHQRHETDDGIRHQRHETDDGVRHQRHETDDGIRHQRHETNDRIRHQRQKTCDTNHWRHERRHRVEAGKHQHRSHHETGDRETKVIVMKSGMMHKIDADIDAEDIHNDDDDDVGGEDDDVANHNFKDDTNEWESETDDTDDEDEDDVNDNDCGGDVGKFTDHYGQDDGSLDDLPFADHWEGEGDGCYAGRKRFDKFSQRGDHSPLKPRDTGENVAMKCGDPEDANNKTCKNKSRIGRRLSRISRFLKHPLVSRRRRNPAERSKENKLKLNHCLPNDQNSCMKNIHACTGENPGSSKKQNTSLDWLKSKRPLCMACKKENGNTKCREEVEEPEVNLGNAENLVGVTKTTGIGGNNAAFGVSDTSDGDLSDEGIEEARPSQPSRKPAAKGFGRRISVLGRPTSLLARCKSIRSHKKSPPKVHTRGATSGNTREWNKSSNVCSQSELFLCSMTNATPKKAVDLNVNQRRTQRRIGQTLRKMFRMTCDKKEASNPEDYPQFPDVRKASLWCSSDRQTYERARDQSCNKTLAPESASFNGPIMATSREDIDGGKRNKRSRRDLKDRVAARNANMVQEYFAAERRRLEHNFDVDFEHFRSLEPRRDAQFSRPTGARMKGPVILREDANNNKRGRQFFNVGGPPLSFDDEFKALEKLRKKWEKSMTYDVALRNTSRNRYQAMLPPDHSLFPIETPFPSDSDYFNASFIPSTITNTGHISYIAAQSPFSPETVDGFWRLVAYRRIETIVMMCNCQEDGLLKSSRYWDDQAVFAEGLVLVRVGHRQSYADFVFRRLEVSAPRSPDLTVYHFQLMTWPHKRVPDDPMALLEMRHRVRSYHGNKTSPILVHCSTGVARTGVYIAVDVLLGEYSRKRQVKAFQLVKRLRRYRPHLIRSLAQYSFVYTCVWEEFHAGDTLLTAAGLAHSMEAMTLIHEDTGNSCLRDEYICLRENTKKLPSSCYIEGRKPENAFKNREPDVLPPDRFRPLVRVSEEPESPDNYINAVLVDGARRHGEFIVTQAPYIHTTFALWRLIFDHQVQTIVSLSQIAHPHSPKFCPLSGSHEFGYFTVEHVNTTTSERGVVSVKNLKLITPTADGVDKRAVKQFEINNWCTGSPQTESESTGNPVTPSDVIDLMSQVLEWQNSAHGRSHPMLVQDEDGTTLAGLFCACVASCERLQSDGRVDVYHLVKGMRHRRKQFVDTFEEYQFIHRVLWEFHRHHRFLCVSVASTDDEGHREDACGQVECCCSCSCHNADADGPCDADGICNDDGDDDEDVGRGAYGDNCADDGGADQKASYKVVDEILLDIFEQTSSSSLSCHAVRQPGSSRICESERCAEVRVKPGCQDAAVASRRCGACGGNASTTAPTAAVASRRCGACGGNASTTAPTAVGLGCNPSSRKVQADQGARYTMARHGCWTRQNAQPVGASADSSSPSDDDSSWHDDDGDVTLPFRARGDNAPDSLESTTSSID